MITTIPTSQSARHELQGGGTKAMSLVRLRQVPSQTFDILSVDVFDTLLLRDLSLQRARFAEVAASLAATLQSRGYPVEARTLLALRRQAHDLAYQAVSLERPNGDASLVRMSEIQAMLLGLPGSLVSAFIDTELLVESRHLAPNHALIEFIAQVRQSGKRVVAMSDMYLSGQQVARLVTDVAGAVPVDHIYTSCDIGLTKHSGSLFAKVASLEGVPVARVLHCGDHPSADVAMAKAAGCQAVLFRRPDWVRAGRHVAALRLLPSMMGAA